MSIFCFTTGLTNVSSMLGIESRDRTISDNYSLLSLINVGQVHTHSLATDSIAETYLPSLPGEGKPGPLCLGDIHLSIYFIINLVS